MLIRNSVCVDRDCQPAPVFSLGQSVFRRDPSNACPEDKPVKEVEGSKDLTMQYVNFLLSPFSIDLQMYAEFRFLSSSASLGNKPLVLG